MKDTKVLNNKDVLVAPISTGMKFSVGLVENPSVFKFQLEKKISGMLFRVKKSPFEKGEIKAKREIKRIMSKHCRRLSNNELYFEGITNDGLIPQINKFLEPKKQSYSPLELIPYNKPRGWSKEFSDVLVNRIQAGNEAQQILDKIEIVSVPAEDLTNLVSIVCDGKSASWVYVHQNLGLAISEAKKYAKKNNAIGDCVLDLIHDSAITLFEATQKYNINKGCSLSTFGTMVIKRRMPRYASKYITLLHVSEEDLKKAVETYYETKIEDFQNTDKETGKTEDDLREKNEKRDYEILTEIKSLDEPVNNTEDIFYETLMDKEMGNPADIVADKSFKCWMWHAVHTLFIDNGFPLAWEWMYKEIVIDGLSPAQVAPNYSVTERTIRNRISKMNAVLREGLPIKQEGFLEFVNYKHQPEAVAETTKETKQK